MNGIRCYFQFIYEGLEDINDAIKIVVNCFEGLGYNRLNLKLNDEGFGEIAIPEISQKFIEELISEYLEDVVIKSIRDEFHIMTESVAKDSGLY